MNGYLPYAVVLLSASLMFGQSRSTGRTQPSGSIPSSGDTFGARQAVYISGQVILADGSKISERVALQTACGDRKSIETYTDSSGNFSFEVKTRPESLDTQTADMSTFGGGTFSGRGSGGTWQGCELRPCSRASQRKPSCWPALCPGPRAPTLGKSS